jgi:hypothetical protein
VAGGQSIYVRTDGSLGFTQAHSVSIPLGAVQGSFTYTKTEGMAYGTLGTYAFGARGFMACPTACEGFQVFAAIDNATAPLGKLDDCLGFDALTMDSTDPNEAAFEYL